jgi:hypothetical protein
MMMIDHGCIGVGATAFCQPSTGEGNAVRVLARPSGAYSDAFVNFLFVIMWAEAHEAWFLAVLLLQNA